MANPTYREALTVSQAGIVVSQFFNSCAVRTERESILEVGPLSNPPLIAAGCLGLGFMAAVSYVPALQSAFHAAALRPTDWLLLAGFGAALLVADETRKAFHRGREQQSWREPGSFPLGQTRRNWWLMS